MDNYNRKGIGNMKISLLQETAQRGTPDFPIEFYRVDKNHPQYHMQTHWHKDIELIRVTRGFLNVQIGDTPYSLTSGDSIYIPGGIAHGAEPDDCDYECIVFSPAILYATQKIRTILKSKIICAVKFTKNDDINFIFESFAKRDSGYEFEIISAIYKIAYYALQNQDTPINNVEYRVDKIKPSILYIEENFSSSISLTELARECSMSANYFCKVFKDVTGQTPVEYMTTYRIEAACEMLLSGISVTDTAYDCGFNDLSYFINVFKRYMGISPKQYAQNRQRTV